MNEPKFRYTVEAVEMHQEHDRECRGCLFLALVCTLETLFVSIAVPVSMVTRFHMPGTMLLSMHMLAGFVLAFAIVGIALIAKERL